MTTATRGTVPTRPATTVTMTDPAPRRTRRRRRHPASGSRILAIGLSSAVALGLITAMGAAREGGASVETAQSAAASAPVVHRTVVRQRIVIGPSQAGATAPAAAVDPVPTPAPPPAVSSSGGS
jgi:hypothetical protein